MKTLILILMISLFTTATFAKESVELKTEYHLDTCGNQSVEITQALKNLAPAIDGRFTVTSRIVEGELCITAVTLQESSYELSVKSEHTKPSRNINRTLNRLAALSKEIQNRNGYLWHSVEFDNYFSYKSCLIESLYVTRKP